MTSTHLALSILAIPFSFGLLATAVVVSNLLQIAAVDIIERVRGPLEDPRNTMQRIYDRCLFTFVIAVSTVSIVTLARYIIAT